MLTGSAVPDTNMGNVECLSFGGLGAGQCSSKATASM